MGGNVKEVQNTQQQTQPWGPAVGITQGILGNLGSVNPNITPQEGNAFSQLFNNAAAGNPFAPAIGGVANTLLAGGGPDRTGMVQDAFTQYQKMMQPFASGQYVDPSSNPELQKYLSVIQNDTTNSVNSQFAAAGRDLSGANTQALGRGIAQGEAPVLNDAYNTARGQQLGAITGMFGAGGQTAGLLSGLDQTRLGNMQAGIGAADQAMSAQQWGPLQELAIEAQKRGIPLQTLAQQMGIALPAAQAFGSQSGTQTKETQVPLPQQIAGYAALAAGIGSKFYKPPGTP